MGIVQMDDVVGYRFEAVAAEDEIIHRNCATVEEKGKAVEANFIMQDEVDNDHNEYFCDRCKKKIV